MSASPGRVAVVGVGADGFGGLAPAARRKVQDAQVLLGSHRQLDLVPAGATGAQRVPWPSPLLPALPGLLQAHRGRAVCVLASGDPMFHGIGATLARLLGPEAIEVLPAPSSASLACARLGWALHQTPVVSAVGRDLRAVLPELAAGRRLLVLSEGAGTPAALAALLAEHGWGASALTVLEQLGGPRERVLRGRADTWGHPPGDDLNTVAVECAGPGPTPRRTRLPGLDDDAYLSDGQLTKQEARALTLCALAPAPGELLWDVGAGSGSIGIEWMRAHPSCRAVAVEPDPDRAARAEANAARLGVPGLRVVRGRAPEALAGLGQAPDAVFVGGAVSAPGVLEGCWQALAPGGRIVANAVTAESEEVLVRWWKERGGRLRRLQVHRAGALGGFTAWRGQLPLAQWAAVKPS